MSRSLVWKYWLSLIYRLNSEKSSHFTELLFVSGFPFREASTPGINSQILNPRPAFNSTYFSIFLFYALKVAELSEFFSPQFCAQPHHSPRAGAERLRGKGPMESRLVRSVGSRGPAGGVMGSVIVPAVWIGWRWWGGWEGGWVALEKKREGRGHLNYLCSPWPLSPSVSPWTDPLSERRGTFPQADAHPPPLFQIALAPSPVLPKLNCNNLPSNVFLLYLSLSENLNFL